MTTIITRITVTEDGRISSAEPLAAGEYVATVERAERPLVQPATEPFDISTLPVFGLGPWPDTVDLSRDSLYD